MYICIQLIHTYTCVYLNAHMFIHVYIYTNMYVYIHICTYIYIYVYVYIYVCMCVCMYVCMYIDLLQETRRHTDQRPLDHGAASQRGRSRWHGQPVVKPWVRPIHTASLAKIPHLSNHSCQLTAVNPQLSFHSCEPNSRRHVSTVSLVDAPLLSDSASDAPCTSPETWHTMLSRVHAMLLGANPHMLHFALISRQGMHVRR